MRLALVPRASDSDEVMPEPRALAILQSLLLKWFADRPTRIYEAGGGSLSYLPTELLEKADITAVDIDPDQIKNNRYARTRICGDIQEQKFPPDSFDLVVCYFVLEHLERPHQAMQRFFDALTPGGLMFIAAPNARSFTGLVTKYTPHWFHVWIFRTVFRDKTAGQPGRGPFPTIYHPLVLPERLIEFAKRHGYEVVYFKKFESVQLGKLRQRYPLLGKLLSTFIRALEFVARMPLREGDYHILLGKPAARPKP